MDCGYFFIGSYFFVREIVIIGGSYRSKWLFLDGIIVYIDY